MKIIFAFIISLFIFAGFESALCQDILTDSIINEVAKEKKDTNQINLLSDVGQLFLYNDPDSSRYYLNKAISLSREINEPVFEASCISTLAISYAVQGDYVQSMNLWEDALKILENTKTSKENKDPKRSTKAAIVNNMGGVHHFKGDYDKALECYQQALQIEDERNNIKGMAEGYGNVGLVHADIGFSSGGSTAEKELELSITYSQKSLAIRNILNDQRGMAMCLNNIGLVYEGMQQFDSALVYYHKSQEINELLNDKMGQAAAFSNIGNIYEATGKYDLAIASQKKSLELSEEIGDKNTISTVYCNLSSLNLSLADSAALNKFQEAKYVNNAIDYALKGLDLADEIESNQLRMINTGNLKNAYYRTGNTDKAFYYAELFIEAKDAMFTEEKTIALAEMESKYQAEKKQLEIEKMEKQREVDNKTIIAQQAINKKQQIIIISVVGVFLIVLVFSIIILRMFREKKRANKLLAQQNEEISQQKEEISSQRDEIEAQRDKVQQQMEIVREQKEEIEDSIHYAKRIQTAVLPSDEIASQILGDHFILFKPKDVVSGDFYWATKLNGLLIVTVADCTGHGVPGAFMSMLGVSFLNEIVRKKEVTDAAQVLNHLRTSIIDALKQTGEAGSQKDGMDMSLAVINEDTRKCLWAGANNPLWIIRSSNKSETIEIEEIKADKMPVAVHVNMADFSNHEIDLSSGDRLYLFSDGFPDQFGGPKGKKFKYKTFKNLICETSELSMKEQGEKLQQNLEEWMYYEGKAYEQLDDITIMGLSIS